MLTVVTRWKERQTLRMLARLFADEQSEERAVQGQAAPRRPGAAAMLPGAMAPAWGAHNRRALQ